jgi:hypothetical protein
MGDADVMAEPPTFSQFAKHHLIINSSNTCVCAMYAQCPGQSCGSDWTNLGNGVFGPMRDIIGHVKRSHDRSRLRAAK